MDYRIFNIISFLLRMFEVFAEFSIVFNLFTTKKKFNFWQLSLIFFIYTLSAELLRAILPYSLSLIIPPTLMSICCITIFKIKWYKIIPVCLLILCTVSILDITFATILVSILNLPSFEALSSNTTLYYLVSFSISIILILIAFLIKYIKQKKDLHYTNSQKNFSLLINAFATFIFIIPNILIVILYFDKQQLHIWIIFLNMFSIIFMMVLSIFNTNRSIKQAVSEERQMYQQNYITTLENLVDGLRTFKHDYSNTLATINGYIQLENWSGLKKFFSQIMDESKAISTLDKLNPNLIKNPTIFGLITAKYQVCLKNNVKMNFEILGTLENLAINEFELSRILGIFLNNAIEAASGSKERKINFLISELKTKTTIEISNSYSSESLKISKTSDLFEKGVSTKGKGRGLGLFKVKQILSKYPHVSLQTISNDNLFLQKLVIPKA